MLMAVFILKKDAITYGTLASFVSHTAYGSFLMWRTLKDLRHKCLLHTLFEHKNQNLYRLFSTVHFNPL